MTSADIGWTNALDHHETVIALDRAVQGQLGEALAEDLAAGLARAGYVLVPLEGRARLVADLLGQVDEHLADEAATNWFGQPKEEDR